MSLSLYYVDKDYIDYLQKTEVKARGFTHVPNMVYENREQKFICGVVMEIREIPYYVPVTSYTIQRDDNILINVPQDTRRPIKGSLRFNYMFPAPEQCITELKIALEEEKRRSLLNKELNFILNNETKLRNKARQTYSKVINRVSKQMVENSCDFKLLERAYKNYIIQMGKDSKSSGEKQ